MRFFGDLVVFITLVTPLNNENKIIGILKQNRKISEKTHSLWQYLTSFRMLKSMRLSEYRRSAYDDTKHLWLCKKVGQTVAWPHLQERSEIFIEESCQICTRSNCNFEEKNPLPSTVSILKRVENYLAFKTVSSWTAIFNYCLLVEKIQARECWHAGTYLIFLFPMCFNFKPSSYYSLVFDAFILTKKTFLAGK